MKYSLLILFCISVFSIADVLPFSQWKSLGPHDVIKDGMLILEKQAAPQRRPEIYQHSTGMTEGESYEILFTVCMPKAGGGLELHVDFADPVHYRFNIEAQNTVWNTYRYEFKAGKGKSRITFLLNTSGDIPNRAIIRNVIIRPKGELLAPPFSHKGDLQHGCEYLTYDVEPLKVYRLSLAAKDRFLWSIQLLDYDQTVIGEVGGEAVKLQKDFQFPVRTTFIKLSLKAQSGITQMDTVSLRKISETEDKQ